MGGRDRGVGEGVDGRGEGREGRDEEGLGSREKEEKEGANFGRDLGAEGW